MKLTQLYYFRILCECASFTKAAEKIHISQPSLSKAIRELEKEAGFLLLSRTPGGVHPTEEGKLFLEHCNRVLDEMKKLEAYTASVEKERISLRVGMPPIFGISFIPEIERLVRESNLELQIRWVEGASVKLHEMLRGHEIDAAILPATLMQMNGLQQADFRFVEEQLYVSRSHPLAKEETVTVEQIKKEKFAFFSERSGQDLLLQDLFRGVDFQPAKQHDSTQLSTVLSLVEQGELIAIIHNNALDMYSKKLDVRCIPFCPPYALRLVLAWAGGGKKEKSIRRLASAVSRDPYRNLRTPLRKKLQAEGLPSRYSQKA